MFVAVLGASLGMLILYMLLCGCCGAHMSKLAVGTPPILRIKVPCGCVVLSFQLVILNPLAQSAHPAAARLQTVGLSSEGRRAKLGISVLQSDCISLVFKGKLTLMTVFHWFFK